MKTIRGHVLISPDDLRWRPSNLMQIPNADYLERTGSEILGARLWRLPPRSANTLHRHVQAEEFYFVVEGVGRMRIGDQTLTVPRHGGVLVGPEELRQVFNDTDHETTWLIVGAPEELEFLQGSLSRTDLSRFYPTDPRQLPPELTGTVWPPAEQAKTAPIPAASQPTSPAPDFAAHAHGWLAAWNAHDLERILAHYADDVEFESPFVATLTGSASCLLRGKSALRGYFERGLAAYPELHFEFIRIYAGDRSCVLEYRSVQNLRAAERMEFDASGKVCRAQAHYACA